MLYCTMQLKGLSDYRNAWTGKCNFKQTVSSDVEEVLKTAIMALSDILFIDQYNYLSH